MSKLNNFSSKKNTHLFVISGFSLLILCCSVGIPYTLAKAATKDYSLSQQVANDFLLPKSFLNRFFSKNKLDLPTMDDVATSKEIWSRVRESFSLAPNRSSPLFEKHIKSLSNSQDYIDKVVRNASPYLYYILEEVEKRGMPSEIALLPVIESDFNPHTLSPKGALGLWQIMPSLGRLHGLKQNAYYDGRKDVYESTKVALDHLEYLHKKFNGNWLLALAAYNCGEVKVLRAIKQNKSANKSTDLWALKLPKETTHFVPKLLAVAAIIKTPAKYGIILPNIPNKPVITRINTGKALDISHAAKLVDVSETQLKKLNPGIRKKAMHPNGPFHLVVPVHQAKGLKEKAQAIKKAAPASSSSPSIRYKIKKGDDLDKLAKKFHTTPESLKALNNLSSDVIITGKFLLIPKAQDSA